MLLLIETITMDSDIYIKIISKIETSTGIQFRYYQKRYVKRRIKSRIKKLKLTSEENYYHYLQSHPKEVDTFLDNFTINYSYFFRNYDVFEKIIAKLDELNLKNMDNLNIWSCPCASGEEPYSLAILIEEKKKTIKNFPEYTIFASDINPRAINNALKGIYGTHALAEMPEPYKNNYFTKISQNPPQYQLNKEIRNKVQFLNEDITMGHKKSLNYHVILCRNFIIYINRHYREMLLNNLQAHLHPEGILVLGKTESLQDTYGFVLIDPIDKFYIIEQKTQLQTEKDDLLQKINKKILKEKKYRESLKQQMKKVETGEHGSIVGSLNNNSLKKEYIDTNIKLNNHLYELKKPMNSKQNSYYNHIKLSKSPIEKKIQNQVIIPVLSSPKNNIPTKAFSPLQTNTEQNEVYLDRSSFHNLEKIPTEQDVRNLTSQIADKRLKLEKLREQIQIELDYINDQREHLQKEISTFQSKKESFEYEKRQYTLELQWFEEQKAQLEREKKEFGERVKEFNNKIQEFDAKVQKFYNEQTGREEKRNKEKELVREKERTSENERKLQKTIQKNIKKKDTINNYPKSREKTVAPPLKEHTLPLGKYIVINKNKNKEYIKSLSIYGLGSTYVLVLFDEDNGIYCMSHVLFSKYKHSSPLKAPEKPFQYATHCVPYLIKKMLLKGSSEKNLKAYIIGGAQIFNRNYTSIKKCFEILKEQLSHYNVALEKKNIGGKMIREVNFDLLSTKLSIITHIPQN
ncbi:MAG: putative Protein-glutamate O-methyltransferase [Promethearchaeota archaeon]|nr:MAG: putative Protein-glutamate O-methyltransferase [Candidatus Lokiarchaeota archaeon]